MLTNADRVLDFILQDEGGLKVSPGEPGGASMRGVSMTAFIEWRHLRGKPTPSLLDLEHMQVWEARELYLQKYMKPIGFNTLPLGVDYVCADEAVNSGVGAALHCISATAHFSDAASRISAITDMRMAAKRASPEWTRYSAGWTNRIQINVPARALAMLTSA